MSSLLQLAVCDQDCLKVLIYILRELLYLPQIIEIFAVFYHLHDTMMDTKQKIFPTTTLKT